MIITAGPPDRDAAAGLVPVGMRTSSNRMCDRALLQKSQMRDC